MIRAVIFDLDGTLLDRKTSLKRFIENQYERMEVKNVSKNNYLSRFIELDRHGYVWKDKVYKQLVEEFRISQISWEDLLTDYMENFASCAVAFPNTIEILEWLKMKEIKVGMITNGLANFQMRSIAALRIESYFDEILISEREGIKKPDKAIFQRALNRLQINAEDSLYVGDHPINDIHASRAIGMKGIWKEDQYYQDDFERDGTIRDLLELKGFIESD